jgi:CBS domain-containing protein
VAGKQDWLAFGLPIEGKLADFRTIGKAAKREIPTCGLTERLGDVQERVRRSGEHACVVLNEEGIVLGLVRKRLWDQDAQALVEQVMESGPATFRPHVTVNEMADYMREKKHIRGALVTMSDGRCVGMVRREDVLF